MMIDGRVAIGLAKPEWIRRFVRIEMPDFFTVGRITEISEKIKSYIEFLNFSLNDDAIVAKVMISEKEVLVNFNSKSRTQGELLETFLAKLTESQDTMRVFISVFIDGEKRQESQIRRGSFEVTQEAPFLRDMLAGNPDSMVRNVGNRHKELEEEELEDEEPNEDEDKVEIITSLAEDFGVDRLGKKEEEEEEEEKRPPVGERALCPKCENDQFKVLYDTEETGCFYRNNVYEPRATEKSPHTVICLECGERWDYEDFVVKVL